MPVNLPIQIFLGTIPIITTIFIAIWINNQRMAELSKRIDDQAGNLGKRLDDLRTYMTNEMIGLRDFIRSENRRLDERIERIEHPIVRS